MKPEEKLYVKVWALALIQTIIISAVVIIAALFIRPSGAKIESYNKTIAGMSDRIMFLQNKCDSLTDELGVCEERNRMLFELNRHRDW